MDADRPLNNLLRTLRNEDYALIAAHLEGGSRSSQELLYNQGDDVETVYFPCAASLVSFVISGEDGREVEATLVGREGAVGGIVSLGHLPAYSRMVVKFGGPFATLSIRRLEEAKSKSQTLRHLFARYADCLLAQVFQSTACNAIHSIQQRAAKWIFAAMQRTGADVVPMTHEELATILGVGRSYTSRIIQAFKSQGILETRRGSVFVLNVDLLNAKSCRCNDAVKHHFDEVLGGVYPAGPSGAQTGGAP